jgi:hypothetical protein
VRRLIKLALVALGIRAFLRWRKRRREAAAPPTAVEPAADPADELRRKLAETREDDAASYEADVTEPPPADVADRRAEVHEQGRATLDAMKSPDEG